MRHIIALIFLFLFVGACAGRGQFGCGGGGKVKSTGYDKRCDKIFEEAWAKRKETGVCDLKPDTDKKTIEKLIDAGFMISYSQYYLTPEKCKDLWFSAHDKCDALPYDPDSWVQTSGSATYRGKKPIMIDGKPVCP